jgi:hypothetical protein
MSRVQLWSSGGGVQSSAIAALIIQGKLPKPDIAAIVDTEREASQVWDFMDEHIKPVLEKVGVELVRIQKSEYATVDLYGRKGEDLLIPVHYDETENGTPGKLPTFCSNEWKQRVIRRYANEQYDNSEFDIWLGFSTDETRRCRWPDGKWQHKFPLIDLKLTRNDCISLVENMGWGTPPRSSCWMCPNRSPKEWLDLKQNYPVDFRAAVAFEKEIQKKDPDYFLHTSCKPLAEVDLNEEQGDMFTCNSGYCFT